VTIRKLLTRCGARMPLQPSMTCLAHSRLDAKSGICDPEAPLLFVEGSGKLKEGQNYSLPYL
jgi:hypothetical protein